MQEQKASKQSSPSSLEDALEVLTTTAKKVEQLRQTIQGNIPPMRDMGCSANVSPVPSNVRSLAELLAIYPEDIRRLSAQIVEELHAIRQALGV